jgi:hypothetical protein
MMVAVSITILMMMATSVVFKSAGAAAGKANSSSEIMQQARVLCKQLENDFKGLRPDMPMAVIFEEESYDTDGDGSFDTFFRRDRIVFFANGDFQTTGNDSGNLARIFYGQARDDFDTPEHLDNPDAPGRRVLTRRYKILTPSTWLPVNSITFAAWTGTTAEEYDDILLENSNESYWKTEDPQNFLDYHFRTWDGVSGKAPGWSFSMVRRPELVEIEAAIDAGTVEADALQQLYMLPDVGDFRIDMWYASNSEWGVAPTPMAVYWNVKDPGAVPGAPELIDPPFDVFNLLAGQYGWFSEDDLIGFGIADPWPKAIRFTFTLYDRDRRYFPDGKTFTYIVRLPRR